MILKIDCPYCSQSIEFPDEIVGKWHECPGCQRQIPLTLKPAATLPKASSIPKVAAPAPKLETELDDLGTQLFTIALVVGILFALVAVVMVLAAVSDQRGSGVLAAGGVLITALVIISQGYIAKMLFRAMAEGIRLLRKISERKP